MSENDKPQSDRARKRAARKARRARLVERREHGLDLLMSGHSVPQIAKATAVSVFAARRAIVQAVADRRLDTQEDFARLQNRADRQGAFGRGRRRHPHFVKVVAEFDRSRGFSRRWPARRPRLASPPPAPLAPKRALPLPARGPVPDSGAREDATA